MLVHANWPPAGVYRQGGPERTYDRPGVREREREREREKKKEGERESWSDVWTVRMHAKRLGERVHASDPERACGASARTIGQAGERGGEREREREKERELVRRVANAKRTPAGVYAQGCRERACGASARALGPASEERERVTVSWSDALPVPVHAKLPPREDWLKRNASHCESARALTVGRYFETCAWSRST